MIDAPGDIVGVVVHGHGKLYTVERQKAALERVNPRAIFDVGVNGFDIERMWKRATANRVLAIEWLFLVCTIRGSAKRKRDLVHRFVDEVRERQGEVLEVGSRRSTASPVERRGMLQDAFEAVTRGRMPSMTLQRGRPKRKWTERERKVFDAVWPSHKYAENEDAAAAASAELGYEITAHQIWTVLGPSGRPWKTKQK